MDIVRARRIVHLVEDIHVTNAELCDLYNTKTPGMLYHEAWLMCFHADLNNIQAKLAELRAGISSLNERVNALA